MLDFDDFPYENIDLIILEICSAWPPMCVVYIGIYTRVCTAVICCAVYMDAVPQCQCIDTLPARQF